MSEEAWGRVIDGPKFMSFPEPQNVTFGNKVIADAISSIKTRPFRSKVDLNPSTSRKGRTAWHSKTSLSWDEDPGT
jgi:hypothetical protein